MTFTEGTTSHLEKIFADLIEAQKESSKNHPSIHQWNPEKTGDMDLLIDRDGRWIHEGREIKRSKIVKLFSTILKLEQGNYFLVSPVEKWQIRVAIAPFFIIDATRELRDAQQAITLKTSTDDIVVISNENPLLVDKTVVEGESTLLVKVRDNLMGFFSRSIYYQLIDWGTLITEPNGQEILTLESMGEAFSLGKIT